MNRHNTKKILVFDRNILKTDLLKEAKLLNIPSGAAEKFVDKIVDDVEKWAKTRPSLTRADLNKRVVAELQKYNDDLSFVYNNRGKII